MAVGAQKFKDIKAALEESVRNIEPNKVDASRLTISLHIKPFSEEQLGDLSRTIKNLSSENETRRVEALYVFRAKYATDLERADELHRESDPRGLISEATKKEIYRLSHTDEWLIQETPYLKVTQTLDAIRSKIDERLKSPEINHGQTMEK